MALIELAREHWKEFQPTKYQTLEESGELEEALSAAVSLTLAAMEIDQKAGLSQMEAWEANRDQFLLLPEEEDLEIEPMPENAAWDALVEVNRLLDKMDEEE